MSRFAARLKQAASGPIPSGPPAPLLDLAFSASLISLGDPDPSGTITENSGLEISRKNTSGDIFWCHNDSGDSARIFAIADGKGILAEYAIGGAVNNDWEDIAIGPGPDPTKDYIYIGNIGATAGSNRRFYRIEEPAVNINQSKVTATIPSGQVETFPFTLPVNDSEGFFVDPISGDLFIFQKVGGSATRPISSPAYRIPASQFVAGGGSLTLTEVCDIRTVQDSTNNGGITAADISQDGKYFVLCNYEELWGWKRDVDAGETVSDVLQANPIAPYHIHYTSGWGSESISFNRDRTRIYTLSEGAGASLKYENVTYS